MKLLDRKKKTNTWTSREDRNRAGAATTERERDHGMGREENGLRE